MTGAKAPRARASLLRRARVAATGVLTAALLLVGLPANAAERVDDFIALPYTTYGDMLVDAAHDRVFVTGGYGTNSVAVVELDGSGVTMLSGTPGATKMSMTQDGSTLYVTLRNGDGIAEIDTTTLAVRRIDTGASSCPLDVAAVDGYVWFVQGGGDCNQWTNIRRLDPVSGQVSPDVSSRSLYEPVLRVVPGTTRLVYAETGISRSALGVVDVAGGAFDVATAGTVERSLPSAVRLTNSGSHLMAGGSGAVTFYRLTDFAEDGISRLTDWWLSAYAADEEVVVGSSRDSHSVEVVRRGADERLNSIALGSTSGGVEVRELELVGQRMFALVRADTLRLYQVDRPAVSPPDLTVAVPTQTTVGTPVTVSGSLSARGLPIAGAKVTVTQDGVEQPLGSPTTDAEGRYTLEFTPQETGSAALTVRYAGDATTKPAVGRSTTAVARRPVTITLGGPASVAPGDPVALTGTLFDGDTAMNQAAVTLQRRCPGYSPWSTVGTASADSTGTFTATDTPGECDSYEYLARYEGDADRLPATSSAVPVAVTWVRPVMRLHAPTDAHVGDAFAVTGTLAGPDGPLAGKKLTATVSTPSGQRSLGALTSDADGRFEVTDTPSVAGSHCYVVEYAGDSGARATSAERCVGAATWATSVSLDGPETARLDEAVVLTGRLLSEQGDAVPAAEVTVSRTDTFAGTEMLDSVTTGADGGFTVRDTPPHGGDVTYAVSYAGTNARAAASASRVVAVSRPERTLTLTTDRKVYGYGQTARITVDLATDSLRTVKVYAKDAGRARTLLFSGEVPDSGLTLQRVMRRNTTLSASIPEDGQALAASTSVARSTKAGLTSKALGGYRTSGSYRLYRPSADPRFSSTVTPDRDRDTCLTFALQRRYSDGWRPVSQSACVPLGDASTATWTLKGTQATNTPYRVRTVFRGDAVNVASTGPWAYVKFA